MATSCRTWRNKLLERRAEAELTSSLPVRSSCTTAHQSLKVPWLLHITSYRGKHLCHPCSPCHRGLPLWKNSPLQLPPTPVLKQSPRPKRWHPSPDPVESMPMGGTTLKATLGGPPRSKRQEIPPWFRTLKPNCTEAFSQDSDMVREARREFFSKHSYNFTTDGTHDLSGIFRWLAASANLLGTSIHEIQASWTGPKELKQANYAL